MRADMFRDATLMQSLRVQAFIEPARQQISMEHYTRDADFLTFLLDNPFVPQGRELIIARGLHLGLLGDFLSSVHLLIPQLEHSVRYLLAQSGIITSGIDDDGIQEEYNLNKMLSASEYNEPLANTIGVDMVFDFQGLLVERFGSNLRNEMAHGLVEYSRFYSVPAAYLWWLSLRFYFLPVLIMFSQEQTSDSEADNEDISQ